VYFAKQRAGSFVETNTTADWPAGNIMTSGDLNNDLRPDMAVAGANEITISFGGTKESARVPLNGMHPQSLMLVDYDNDGWLDLIACGDGVRVWRNRGKAGFEDVTAA